MNDNIWLIKNGHNMWHEYGKPYHYNPNLGLHFHANEKIPEKIKNHSVDDETIKRLRWYCTAIRVHDPIVYNMVDCGLYSLLSDYAREAKKPELSDNWEGFSQENFCEVIDKFVGLLDPLTMQYVDSNNPKVEETPNGHYIYTPENPVPETDTTFLYNPDRDNKKKIYQALYNNGIYEEIEQAFVELLPDELHDLYLRAGEL